MDAFTNTKSTMEKFRVYVFQNTSAVTATGYMCVRAFSSCRVGRKQDLKDWNTI
jgi:hypothetical protein